MSRPKKLRLDQIQGQRNKSQNATRITAATVALMELKDGDRKLIPLITQSGQAFTLPYATGKGGCYRFFQEKSITSNTNTFVVQAGNNPKTGAQDALFGNFQIVSTGTAGSFAASSGIHTATMNGSTQGGIAGSYFEIEDVYPGVWRINGRLNGSGVAATPFS